MGVSDRIKFESSSGYKAILNYAISYFMALMMTGPEFSENSKKDQINIWLECNSMTLDRIIVEV